MVDCNFTLGRSILTTMNDLDYAEIGQRLIAIRRAFGLQDESARSWATRHGFNETQWNNWELGRRRIPVDQAEKLCETYGLTLDFIFRNRRDGLAETASKRL